MGSLCQHVADVGFGPVGKGTVNRMLLTRTGEVFTPPNGKRGPSVCPSVDLLEACMKEGLFSVSCGCCPQQQSPLPPLLLLLGLHTVNSWAVLLLRRRKSATHNRMWTSRKVSFLLFVATAYDLFIYLHGLGRLLALVGVGQQRRRLLFTRLACFSGPRPPQIRGAL